MGIFNALSGNRQAIARQSAERGACKALAMDRSSVRYKPLGPDDADLRAAMNAVTAQRRRLGCRRIHLMLKRQASVMNFKKPR